ncbi:MAG: hypothetical protein WD378_09665 [Egicoccus sp.]
MLLNHDMQDLRAEVDYRRAAMQRALAGSRRRRRHERRSGGQTPTDARVPTDG